MTVFWDVALCSLVEIEIGRRFRGAYCFHREGDDDEGVRSSETSVSFYQTTRRNIPEDGHLQNYIHLKRMMIVLCLPTSLCVSPPELLNGFQQNIVLMSTLKANSIR
jgi:hypothetical protein